MFGRVFCTCGSCSNDILIGVYRIIAVWTHLDTIHRRLDLLWLGSYEVFAEQSIQRSMDQLSDACLSACDVTILGDR